MKPINTFPLGGWCCITCRRSFADIFLRWGCPYCPRPLADLDVLK